ncbi:hypothetical protein P8452_33327 [Trifolium repens]|nr:hypothetical protein P8452_33327 [Trifolium repens]
MGFYSVASPSIPLIPGLESFLGDHLISNVVQLSSSQCEGVVYVIACYFDVIEGVDMWYGDDNFRLKISAGELSHEVPFVMYDSVVSKIVPKTCCQLLLSVKQGSSTFPDELEEHIGDAFLLKVLKKCDLGDTKKMVYNVLDVFYDPLLLEIFLDPDHPLRVGRVTLFCCYCPDYICFLRI